MLCLEAANQIRWDVDDPCYLCGIAVLLVSILRKLDMVAGLGHGPAVLDTSGLAGNTRQAGVDFVGITLR